MTDVIRDQLEASCRDALRKLYHRFGSGVDKDTEAPEPDVYLTVRTDDPSWALCELSVRGAEGVWVDLRPDGTARARLSMGTREVSAEDIGYREAFDYFACQSPWPVDR